MNEILAAQFIAPEVKQFLISAPLIARAHQAGQFVILRVHGSGERILFNEGAVLGPVW